MQNGIYYVNALLSIWSFILTCMTLRNVYKLEFNIRRSEKDYIFLDNKIIYRTVLRVKVWLLFLMSIALITFAGLRIYPVLYPFQNSAFAWINLCIFSVFFLLCLIFYLVYRKDDFTFLSTSRK